MKEKINIRKIMSLVAVVVLFFSIMPQFAFIAKGASEEVTFNIRVKSPSDVDLTSDVTFKLLDSADGEVEISAVSYGVVNSNTYSTYNFTATLESTKNYTLKTIYKGIENTSTVNAPTGIQALNITYIKSDIELDTTYSGYDSTQKVQTLIYSETKKTNTVSIDSSISSIIGDNWTIEVSNDISNGCGASKETANNIVNYTGLGKADITVKATGDYEDFYNSVTYKLNIVNDISVNTSSLSNQYISDGNGSYIDTYTYSDSGVYVNLKNCFISKMDSDVQYFVDNGSALSNEDATNYKFTSCRTYTITAKSRNDGTISKSFKIKIAEKQVAIGLKYGDELINNNDNKNIDANSYDNNNPIQLTPIVMDGNNELSSDMVEIKSADTDIISITDNKIIVEGADNSSSVDITVKLKTEVTIYTASTFTLHVTVNPADINIKAFNSNDEDMFATSETSPYIIDENDIVDKKITLWNSMKYYDKDGADKTNTISSKYNVNVSCESRDIVFDGNNVIKSTDYIERNVVYKIKVENIKNTRKNPYPNSTGYIYIKVVGVNDDNPYDIKYLDGSDESTANEAVITGKDGNLWSRTTDIYAVKSGKKFYKYDNNYTWNSTIYNDALKLTVYNGESYDKEHKYDIVEDSNNITIRRYFGVDTTNPQIDTGSVSLSDNCKKVVSGDKIYLSAKGSWSVSMKATDKYLYSWELLDGETVKLEGNITSDDGTFTVNVPTSLSNAVDLKVVVYDRAGNSDTYKLGDFVQDSAAPVISTFTTDVSSDVKSFIIGDKLYYNGNVVLNFSVTDSLAGLAYVKTAVNGIVSTSDYELSYLTGRKTNTAQFSVDTSQYSSKADGSINIEVEAEDQAGVKTNPNASKTVYIDTVAPEAVSVKITPSNGKQSVLGYGNYYSDSITVELTATDSASGLKNAIINIGTKSISAEFNDGKAVFVIPVGVSGETTFVLTDNVNNSRTCYLKEINSNFMSNNIVIESDPVFVDITPTTSANKNGFYNRNVDINVKAYEINISSGIKSVNTYVNNTEVGNQLNDVSNNTLVDKVEYSLAINDNVINQLKTENGLYAIKVVIVDNAGNEKTYNKDIYIDKINPVIDAITGVNNGGYYNTNQTIEVNTSEEVNQSGNTTFVEITKNLDGESKTKTLTFDAGHGDNKRTQNFTFDESGNYVVNVKSVDNADNESNVQTITFTIDLDAPILNVTGVDKEYYLSAVTMNINVEESFYDTASLIITAEKTLNGATSAVNLEQFMFTGKNSNKDYVFTDDGTYIVTVSANDRAGNTSSTRTFNFTIDNTDPEINVTVDGNKLGGAFKGDLTPVITISDDYFKSYTMVLYKSSVIFDSSAKKITSLLNSDVTKDYLTTIQTSDKGGTVSINTLSKIQDNDGIYTLIVTAEDMSGRTKSESYTFTLNRFGSVYTFNDNLNNLIDGYVKSVDNNLVITEYNADKIVEGTAKVSITRDGSPISNASYSVSPTVNDDVNVGSSGWYQYDYTIDKSNFINDGVYEVVVSSQDKEGNKSENITYDAMAVRFCVDNTKPEITSVMGLDKSMYNADRVDVSYTLFDAIGLKKVTVYIGDDIISTVEEFDNLTDYTGSFSLSTGVSQKIRFVVEDLAGNVLDTSNADDVKSGKIAHFEDNVTVSTNLFVRYYANKPLFYGTIGGGTAVVVGGAGGAVFFRKRRLKAKM